MRNNDIHSVPLTNGDVYYLSRDRVYGEGAWVITDKKGIRVATGFEFEDLYIFTVGNIVAENKDVVEAATELLNELIVKQSS